MNTNDRPIFYPMPSVSLEEFRAEYAGEGEGMMAAEMMHRPLTREQIAERMDEYRARTAPIIKQMAEIEGFRPPRKVLLHPDGSMELGPEEPLPPEAEATAAELRSLIESIARELFPDVAAGSQSP